MDYWRRRDSKVKISDGLRFRGWSIYGYKEDRSDSMTDYFDPENWDGIAVKNGYILVVDNSSGGTIGGDFIHRSYDAKLSQRIQKLQALADCPSASEGERANALAMIEKLGDKVVKEVLVTSDQPAVTYQKNPGNSKWHIEKGGQIIAKGTGVFGFGSINTWREEKIIFDKKGDNYMNDMLRYYNIDDGEEGWNKFIQNRKKERSETVKELDRYFNLLDKWDSIVQIKIGEGEENKLVQKTISKEVVYYIAEPSDKPTGFVQIGERWRVGSLSKYDVFKTYENGSHVKHLTRQWTTFQDGTSCRTYKLEPRKSTKSKYVSITGEDFEKGVWVHVKLVKKIDRFEETVWVEEKTKPKKTSSKIKNDRPTSSIDFDELLKQGAVRDYEHTRTGEILKVFDLDETLSKEDFKAFNQYLISNNIAYYSKYAKGFIIKNIEKLGAAAAAVVTVPYSTEILNQFASGSLF